MIRSPNVNYGESPGSQIGPASVGYLIGLIVAAQTRTLFSGSSNGPAVYRATHVNDYTPEYLGG